MNQISLFWNSKSWFVFLSLVNRTYSKSTFISEKFSLIENNYFQGIKKLYCLAILQYFSQKNTPFFSTFVVHITNKFGRPAIFIHWSGNYYNSGCFNGLDQILWKISASTSTWIINVWTKFGVNFCPNFGHFINTNRNLCLFESPNLVSTFGSSNTGKGNSFMLGNYHSFLCFFISIFDFGCSF